MFKIFFGLRIVLFFKVYFAKGKESMVIIGFELDGLEKIGGGLGVLFGGLEEDTKEIVGFGIGRGEFGVLEEGIDGGGEVFGVLEGELGKNLGPFFP